MEMNHEYSLCACSNARTYSRMPTLEHYTGRGCPRDIEAMRGAAMPYNQLRLAANMRRYPPFIGENMHSPWFGVLIDRNWRVTTVFDWLLGADACHPTFGPRHAEDSPGISHIPRTTILFRTKRLLHISRDCQEEEFAKFPFYEIFALRHHPTSCFVSCNVTHGPVCRP